MLSVAFGLSVASLAQTPLYSVRRIVVPDSQYVYPTCINNNGSIAGYWGNDNLNGGMRDASGFTHSNGVTTKLPSLGGSGPVAINSEGLMTGGYTGFFSDWKSAVWNSSGGVVGTVDDYTFGINDRGDVVGWNSPNDELGGGLYQQRPFFATRQTSSFWQATYIQHDSSNPGRTWVHGTATDINNVGSVVGSFSYDSGPSRGYIYRKGQLQWLEGSGFPALTSVSAVNDSDTVAGYTEVNGAGRAAVWKSSGGQVLPFIENVGSSWSTTTGINGTGDIVGFQSGPWQFSYEGVAVLWRGGSSIMLQNYLDASGLGWSLGKATGINDSGVIVGVGVYNGQVSGFELTPVPEPATLAALGLGALGLLRRRKVGGAA